MATTIQIVGNKLEIVDKTDSLDNISIYNAAFLNFDKICRFCLRSEGLKPFFDMTYKQTSIQSIIFDCSSLKVNPEDLLPSNLCETCITELISFYKFKKRCLQVTNLLQDAYDNRESKETIQSNIKCYDGNNFINETKESLDVPTVSNDNFLEDTSSDLLDIKQEVIEDTQIVCNDNILEDPNSHNWNIKYEVIKDEENMNTYNLIIKNKTIKEKPTICIDIIPKDTNQYNAIDNTLKNVRKHLKQKRADTGERSYACKCRRTFHTETAFVNHIKIHSRKSLGSKYHLNDHTTIHTGDKWCKCFVCTKSFAQKSQLTRHVSIHSECQYKCSVCTKSFTQKSLLQKHMLIHTGKRPYNCSVCMKTFPSKSHLDKHKLIHKGERLNECIVCMKCLNQKSNNNEHMSNHQNEGGKWSALQDKTLKMLLLNCLL